MKTRILIPLMAGLALLCACKGKSSSSEAADSSSAVNYNAKNPGTKNDTIEGHPKVVKTADMNFQVKDVRQTTEQITALTANYNGTVVHHWMKSVPVDSTDIRKSDDSIMRVTVINSSAEMTIKIPPSSVENFIGQVARLGIYIKNLRMDVSDKTLDYLSARLKLKNQNELLNQQRKEADNKKDPDNLLAFKNNMVDQQINNRKIDDSVKNSIVILSFYEDNRISKKIIANNNLSAYNLSFSKRAGMSFENGWGAFVDVFVWLTNLWPLLPIGFGVWMLIRHIKIKKAAALFKS